jgi:2-methylcitrate dehydratase PrpD
MCAAMLLDGIVTFETAHDEERMRDPRLLELRKRIELYGDDEMQRLLPERHGSVSVRLRDGREFSHYTSAVRGTAENPMTRTEVDEKCYHLMAPVLGKRRARQLCDAVWQLEKLPDVRALRPLLHT